MSYNMHFQCFFFYLRFLDSNMFLVHPEDVITKPGLRAEFSIATTSTANTYKWHFQGKEISSEETDYIGTTTNTLIIEKCLPKHKGSYKCVVTFLDKSEEIFISESATLTIGMFENCNCMEHYEVYILNYLACMYMHVYIKYHRFSLRLNFDVAKRWYYPLVVTHRIKFSMIEIFPYRGKNFPFYGN